MKNTSNTPTNRKSYAEAISEVQLNGVSDLRLIDGNKTKLNCSKLISNYKSILRMAGVEQMLGEKLGIRKGSPKKLAESDLSCTADVPPYWAPSLGDLINLCNKGRLIDRKTFLELIELKEIRDKVMHGNKEAFGNRSSKSIKHMYEHLLKNCRFTPSVELNNRIIKLSQSVLDKKLSEEIIETLRILYLAIEVEAEIRTALYEVGINKGSAALVESILELKSLSKEHQKVFSRENLHKRIRACAMIRNHLVHGSIITPNQTQLSLVIEAHKALGYALAEIRFKKSGKNIIIGEFNNTIHL
jgi:hypothetical protein